MKSLRQIVELKKIDLTPDPELQAGQVSNYANPKSCLLYTSDAADE